MMEHSGRRNVTGSGVRQEETTADFRHTAIKQFFSTPKMLTCIDDSVVWAARKTCSRCNETGPLDNKMENICVSLAHTHTHTHKITTRLIKSWKTSNESWSYNPLNHVNRMYKHDLFNLQKCEAWLVPVYIQICTTKSQLTECTEY